MTSEELEQIRTVVSEVVEAKIANLPTCEEMGQAIDVKFVDLKFVGRQLERVLDRIGAMEDQMAVQTATILRLDATVGGLTTEVRAINHRLDRTDKRVRKLEDEQP